MKKRWWISVVIVAILICWNISYRLYYQAKFDRRVKELSEQGYPVSLDDLEKTYVLPANVKNAADIYIEAFSHYQEPNEFTKELLPYYHGNHTVFTNYKNLPQETFEAMHSFLNTNKESLELLDKASQIENCLWPRKLDCFYFSNEYLAQIKDAAKLLCIRNLYLSQQGEIKQLLNSINTSILVSKTLKTQPFLIDLLVYDALKSLIAKNLEATLTSISLNEFQLKKLQHELANMSDTEFSNNAFVNEQVGSIAFWQLTTQKQIENFANNPFLALPPRFFQILYSISGIKQKDAFLSLRYCQQHIQATQLPLHKRLQAFQLIDEEIERLPEWHIYAKVGIVRYAILIDIDLRAIGCIKSAETALAVERYRLKYESLPESLEKLVPEFMEEVPRDPFDNNVLRYIRHDVGYTVYTIGEDGIDNGGLSKEQMKEKTGQENPEEYDWPFTVRR